MNLLDPISKIPCSFHAVFEVFGEIIENGNIKIMGSDNTEIKINNCKIIWQNITYSWTSWTAIFKLKWKVFLESITQSFTKLSKCSKSRILCL